MQTYIGGIRLLGPAGATWAIAPQVGDLKHVDVGFSTTLGRFSSKWSINGTTFRIQISTLKGTTGTVAVPLPGNFTSGILTGAGRGGDVVHADESGRYWIDNVAGGDHDFSVVGL